MNDNNQYFAKVQPQLAAGQAISADVFVVTDWMASKFIQLGYVQPLGHSMIPNIKYLQPSLLNVPFDVGRKYSLTWQIAACMAWTGDVVQLKADNPDLTYTLPAAGYTLWSDNFVIPVRTPHKKNAELLINYYYEPAVAAKVADAVNYITPVTGTQAILAKTDPTVAKNELIFPTSTTLAKAKGLMELDADQEKRYSAAFAKLSGA